MKKEDGERYCRAFDALVSSIDKAVLRYRTEAQKCLGNERTSALATWIMRNKPKLETSVRGLQVLITWLEEAKSCRKAKDSQGKRARSLSEGNVEKHINNFDCLLSTAESINDEEAAASEDSMTLLDTMIYSLEEFTGQPLLQVFDEFPNDNIPDTSNGDTIPHESSHPSQSRNTAKPVNQEPHASFSNHLASWERSYYTFQTALIRYKDIEGLEAIAVNKQVSAEDQRAASELIVWSKQQRMDRQSGRLNKEQISKLDSLVRRRLWCWDLPRGRSQAQSAKPSRTGSTSDHAPMRELDDRPAFPDPDDAPPTSSSSASATAAGKKVARKIVAKKIPRKKVRGKVSAEEKAQNIEWSEYFHLLQLYGASHENYQVPQEYVTRNSRGEEVALGVWLYVQMISLEEYMTEAPQWYEALAELIQEGKLWPVDHSACSSSSGPAPTAPVTTTATGSSAGNSRRSSPAMVGTHSVTEENTRESSGAPSRGVKRRMFSDQSVSQSSSRSASPHHTSQAQAHKKGMSAREAAADGSASTAAEHNPEPALKASHTTVALAPPSEPASFSLKNKELFRRSGDLSDASRETYSDQDMGVSLPRPSLSKAGSSSASRLRPAPTKPSTTPVEVVSTWDQRLAADATSAAPARPFVPASAQGPAGDPNSATQSSNSLPRPTGAGTAAPARNEGPSVSLLAEVYVALVYREGTDATAKPPRLGLGRVISGAIPQEDEAVEIEMLTAHNSEDPVRSSYRSAGRVVTIVTGELLLTDLRMVQGRNTRLLNVLLIYPRSLQ
jgi:hypothetical protein